MRNVCYVLFLFLCALLCFAYPIAVTGVAFDVKPPFSLNWAGSALLFLEGSLLILAAMLFYGLLHGLVAGLLVIVLSYLVEAVGVSTGFPFGVYSYTDILFPKLPANVPLAVMFAWVLIVFGVYGWIHKEKQKMSISMLVLGAALATLLDLEIEPVAAHLERYWLWQAPGPLNYYGVPLVNFVAWFVVAFFLLLLVHTILSRATTKHSVSHLSQIPHIAPRLLFVGSLLMFGLVDITHGYYAAALVGVLAACILLLLARFRSLKAYLARRSESA